MAKRLSVVLPILKHQPPKQIPNGTKAVDNDHCRSVMRTPDVEGGDDVSKDISNDPEANSDSEICAVCFKAFSHYDQLKQHMESAHASTVGCIMCFAEFDSGVSLIKHIKTHSNHCDKCQMTLSSQNQLLVHFQKVHRNMSFKKKSKSCPDCSKKFESKSEYMEHRLTHKSKQSCTFKSKKNSTPLAVSKSDNHVNKLKNSSPTSKSNQSLSEKISRNVDDVTSCQLPAKAPSTPSKPPENDAPTRSQQATSTSHSESSPPNRTSPTVNVEKSKTPPSDTKSPLTPNPAPTSNSKPSGHKISPNAVVKPSSAGAIKERKNSSISKAVLFESPDFAAVLCASVDPKSKPKDSKSGKSVDHMNSSPVDGKKCVPNPVAAERRRSNIDSLTHPPIERKKAIVLDPMTLTNPERKKEDLKALSVAERKKLVDRPVTISAVERKKSSADLATSSSRKKQADSLIPSGTERRKSILVDTTHPSGSEMKSQTGDSGKKSVISDPITSANSESKHVSNHPTKKIHKKGVKIIQCHLKPGVSLLSKSKHGSSLLKGSKTSVKSKISGTELSPKSTKGLEKSPSEQDISELSVPKNVSIRLTKLSNQKTTPSKGTVSSSSVKCKKMGQNLDSSTNQVCESHTMNSHSSDQLRPCTEKEPVSVPAELPSTQKISESGVKISPKVTSPMPFDEKVQSQPAAVENSKDMSLMVNSRPKRVRKSLFTLNPEDLLEETEPSQVEMNFDESQVVFEVSTVSSNGELENEEEMNTSKEIQSGTEELVVDSCSRQIDKPVVDGCPTGGENSGEEKLNEEESKTDVKVDLVSELKRQVSMELTRKLQSLGVTKDSLDAGVPQNCSLILPTTTDSARAFAKKKVVSMEQCIKEFESIQKKEGKKEDKKKVKKGSKKSLKNAKEQTVEIEENGCEDSVSKSSNNKKKFTKNAKKETDEAEENGFDDLSTSKSSNSRKSIKNGKKGNEEDEENGFDDQSIFKSTKLEKRGKPGRSRAKMLSTLRDFSETESEAEKKATESTDKKSQKKKGKRSLEKTLTDPEIPVTSESEILNQTSLQPKVRKIKVAKIKKDVDSPQTITSEKQESTSKPHEKAGRKRRVSALIEVDGMSEVQPPKHGETPEKMIKTTPTADASSSVPPSITQTEPVVPKKRNPPKAKSFDLDDIPQETLIQAVIDNFKQNQSDSLSLCCTVCGRKFSRLQALNSHLKLQIFVIRDKHQVLLQDCFPEAPVDPPIMEEPEIPGEYISSISPAYHVSSYSSNDLISPKKVTPKKTRCLKGLEIADEFSNGLDDVVNDSFSGSDRSDSPYSSIISSQPVVLLDDIGHLLPSVYYERQKDFSDSSTHSTPVKDNLTDLDKSLSVVEELFPEPEPETICALCNAKFDSNTDLMMHIMCHM
nr:PREDICTED: uncharacterized protein DDB_G0284459-like [Bemisia tabaci]